MAFIRKVVSRGCAYAQLVSTERVSGKVKTRIIKHIGPWKHLSENLLRPEDGSSFVSRDYGDINILFKLLNELKLIEIINKNTNKNGGINVGELSSSIIINHCVDPASKNQIGSWFGRTYLPQLFNINSSKINKDSLTRVLDYLTEGRIIKIEKKIIKQLEKLFNLNKEGLFYDISSTYVYGDKCEMAKYGYNRDHVPEKQINFGLILSKIGNFPLMHKIFDGNTVDVTTVCSTADSIKNQFNINSCMLVLDRGMISENNLIHLDKQGFGYIAGLSKSTNESKEIIMEAKNFNEIGDETYACESIRLHNGIKKKYVIIQNKKKQKDDKKIRKKIIGEKKEELNKLREKIKIGKIKDRDKVVLKIGEIIKDVKKYFVINHKKENLDFSFSLNKITLLSEELLDGKHLICCTDESMSAEEIIMAYRDKDKVEKAFRCIKSFIRVRPIRHWKDNRVKAHIFLCILAYLLQKILEYKLEQNGLNMTAQEVLSTLSEVKMISYNVGDYQVEKVTKIGDDQKLILRKLGY